MNILFFLLWLFLDEALATESSTDSDTVNLLDAVTVFGQKPQSSMDVSTALKVEKLEFQKKLVNDTAEIFQDIPGVHLNTGGGISALPAIHGLADDRLKISVNGMNITSACSNHMNPALSYIAPSSIGKAIVIPGVTPVSMGGDSIGGVIAVDPISPKFASQSEQSIFSGNAGGFFKSANDNFGSSLNSHYANQKFSIDYSGSWSKAANYRTGGNNRLVVPSRFQTTNHYLRLAKALDRGFIAADVSVQQIPYQGFPNQRMDLSDNNAILGGVSFENTYDWGKLVGRVYHHKTWHTMDTLDERRTAPMPMKTIGSDMGYKVQAEIPFAEIHTFRIGNEFTRQTLQDWWPRTTQSLDFLSVNNGERNRVGTYLDWQADWNDRWSSQLGLRNDMVFMDTEKVHAYESMQSDLTARLWQDKFNTASRARFDQNYDVSAVLRYTPDALSQYELGAARKTRSPNLYERYSWYGHNSMITWFGDGNAYAGNLDLKPETAYNFTLAGDWHDANQEVWYVHLAPYFNHIGDYIYAQPETRSTTGQGFRGLQFINLPYANIWGADFSSRYAFLTNSDFGKIALKGKLSYVRGMGKDDMSGRSCPYAEIGLIGVCQAKGWAVDGLQSPKYVNLYHMMPVYGSLALEHGFQGEWGQLDTDFIVDLVNSKTTIATGYSEPKTPGYVLFNIRSRYKYKNMQLNFGVENLLDKFYYHPLSGIDIVSTYAQGFPLPQLLPVAAMGRSVFVSVNFDY